MDIGEHCALKRNSLNGKNYFLVETTVCSKLKLLQATQTQPIITASLWHFFNNKKAKWTNTTKKGYDLSATRLNKELKNVKFLKKFCVKPSAFYWRKEMAHLPSTHLSDASTRPEAHSADRQL